MTTLVFICGLVLGVLLASGYWQPRYKREKNKSLTDRLTGLNNGYYFEDNAQRLLHEKNVAALIDIDNFKRFNSLFGYEVADELLKLFVRRVKKALPPEAEFIRYKFGDEFLIVLPGSTTTNLKEIIDFVNVDLRNDPLLLGGVETDLQFSGGVTELQATDTPQSMARRLSLALQQAKKTKDVTVIL